MSICARLRRHPTEYGVQFVTWDRTHNQTSLQQGHYFGPGCGAGDYTAAKQDFAVRSGLIPAGGLFLCSFQDMKTCLTGSIPFLS